MTGRYTRNLSPVRSPLDCSDENLATHRAQLGEINNFHMIWQQYSNIQKGTYSILMFSLKNKS
jgi:hypothetical protein